MWWTVLFHKTRSLMWCFGQPVDGWYLQASNASDKDDAQVLLLPWIDTVHG